MAVAKFLKSLLLFFLLLFSEAALGQRLWGGGQRASAPTDTIDFSRFELMLDSMERVEKLAREIRRYEANLMRDERRFHYDAASPLLRGIIQTSSNRDYRNNPAPFLRRGSDAADYAVAALPLAATWTLKAAGVESRSKTRRMLLANVISLALAGGTTQILKHTVSQLRPDHSDRHSFPSGHSTLAYAAATILEREYGHVSPWITVGGYVSATATEYLRQRNHANYINDIFMGAGIGTVSTNLAYFLTDKIYGPSAINQPQFYLSDMQRYGRFVSQPTSFSLVVGSQLTSRKFTVGGMPMQASSTYMSGFNYAYYFNEHLAAEAEASLSMTGVKPRSDDLCANTLEQYNFGAGLRYSWLVGMSSRFGLRVMAGDVFTPQTTFSVLPSGSHPSTVQPFELGSCHDFQLGAGVNFEFIQTRNYVTGFSVDYNHVFSSLMPNRTVISSYWKILL